MTALHAPVAQSDRIALPAVKQTIEGFVRAGIVPAIAVAWRKDNFFLIFLTQYWPSWIRGAMRPQVIAAAYQDLAGQAASIQPIYKEM